MYSEHNLKKKRPTLKFHSKPIGFPAFGVPPILGHTVYEPGRDV